MLGVKKRRGKGKPMKWAFQIKRTTLDRQNLIDLLAGIGFQPADIPGFDFAFWSPTFETYENASQVWEQAKRIRDLFSEVTEIGPEFILGPVIDWEIGREIGDREIGGKSGTGKSGTGSYFLEIGT